MVSRREYLVPEVLAASLARYPPVTLQRPPVRVYVLIMTTVRDVAVALGRTTPEAVNGTPATGADENAGLLAVPATLAWATAGRPATSARTNVSRTSPLRTRDM
jgi:hypothetical protein